MCYSVYLRFLVRLELGSVRLNILCLLNILDLVVKLSCICEFLINNVLGCKFSVWNGVIL